MMRRNKTNIDGYWDMNIPLEANQQDLQQKYIDITEKFGYSGILFTNIINDRQLQQNDVCTYKHIKNTRLKQGSRLLCHLHDLRACQPFSSSNPCLKTYDVLSVRPLNEKVFHHACKQMNIDIISLDLTKRLPFHIKKVHVNMALTRGVYFEICYAPMLHDRISRRNIISNGLHLINMCRGRNIIFSSNATSPMDIRAPYDVQNLGLMFRIQVHMIKSLFTSAAWHINMHAKARNSQKMVMTIEDIQQNDEMTNIEMKLS